LLFEGWSTKIICSTFEEKKTSKKKPPPKIPEESTIEVHIKERE
jgi:hypothetical protein